MLLFGGAGNSGSIIKKEALKNICYPCTLVGMSPSILTPHNCLHVLFNEKQLLFNGLNAERFNFDMGMRISSLIAKQIKKK